jgi:hypothetical protein
VKAPVDAVLPVDIHPFTIKGDSYGVDEVCTTTPLGKTNKMHRSWRLQATTLSRTWRRIAGSESAIFTATGLRGKRRRRVLLPVSCSAHEAKHPPC